MTAPPADASGGPLDFRRLWIEAVPFAQFLRPAMKHFELWDGVYRRVQVPAWAREAASALGPFHLLVIAEDWCGDAANVVPVLAAWTDGLTGAELRVIRRDEHPELMNRYLTNGTRSIPVVIALDPAFRELGHWGPRPSELQAWVVAHKATLPKDQRYAEARRWYARDRGETTLRELLAAIRIRPA